MRKLTALILAFLMVFSLTTQAFAATVSVEADKQTVSAGEQVIVTVNQNADLDGVIAIEYRVYYDPDLFTLSGSELAANHDLGKTITDTKGTYQVINYLDKTSEGVTIPAGTIATLTFTAKETVTQEQSAGFELVNAGVMDVNGDMITDNTVENGTVSITVSPAEPEVQQYTVTLPESPVGYTIAPAADSSSPVVEGGSYSFTVTVDTENYEGTPVVKANGLNLFATDGVYTISNITEDQTVTVEGIQEQGLAADRVIYQHGSNGAQWPSGTPVYVNTVTLKGLSVTDVVWDASYETCTITLHKKTAADASYSLATVVAVSGAPQMISMFSADINGSTYGGNSFTHSGSLENGQAEIVYAAKAGNYSGTKTIKLVVDGTSVEPEPETYEVTLTQGEGYNIAASEGSASPVTEGGNFSFTVTANNGYEGPTAVKANNTELTAVDGVYTIENITADQVVTVEGITVKANMYTVAASADVTASKGDTASVSVRVTGNSNEEITGYNDYDVTVSYDPAVLTYVSAAAAHSGAEITCDDIAGTIRVIGHGEAKSFADAVVTLNFTTLAPGSHDVTVTSAKIDNSGNAIALDAPEAAVSDRTTVIKVAYPVTLPDNFTGDLTVLPGGDYQFTSPNEYYDITVTVGGEEVTPNVDGLVYTIYGVNGDVVITAVGKTYKVTKSGENVTIDGADNAQYGADYSFTVTADSGYSVANVSVKVGDAAVDYTISGGKYIISGSKITGDVTVTVTTQQQTVNTTQITFEGVDASEVVGGLVQYAANGQDFTFELNEEEGYAYTAKLGEEELKSNGGVYTIPGTQINGTALTVTISKEVYSFHPEVTVSQYIQLNETVMWLITATEGDNVLAYGEGNTMFWSGKYNAYCWLVVSSESEEAVKQAAESTICAAAEDAMAAEIAYDYDVNQTGAVDINDAQLTYDMYQAKMYSGFDIVAMDKFLEADVNGDTIVNVEDAAAVVAQILK